MELKRTRSSFSAQGPPVALLQQQGPLSSSGPQPASKKPARTLCSRPSFSFGTKGKSQQQKRLLYAAAPRSGQAGGWGAITSSAPSVAAAAAASSSSPAAAAARGMPGGAGANPPSGALRWRAAVDPLETSIRQMFESIADGKGHITEADLVRYAADEGLPAAYVAPFMRALSSSGVGSGDGGGDSGAGDDEASRGAGVGFRRFRRFVAAREAGLRAAFDLFDRDGDGKISHDDLDLSLAHVSVYCPSTRCVMRCRRRAVADLLAAVDGGANGGVASAGGGTSSSSSGGSGGDVTFDDFRRYFSLLPENDASMVVEYWLSAAGAVACADMGTRVAVQPAGAAQPRGSPWGHLVAGAVAGAASRTATAPLETLRLAAMAGGAPAGARLDVAAAEIVSKRGWRGLYKGNGANVLRSAPQKALDFFTFNLYKGLLAASGGGGGGGASSIPRDATPRETFLAAGLAGATSCLLLHPLDVARTRLTLDAAGRYSGVADCLRQVAAAEGGGALLRGLGPSLAAIFPEAAITYGLHDLLKRAYRRATRREPGIGASLAAGVVSASVGQLVAYPLETVSRRMQLGALPPPRAVAAWGGLAGAGAGAGGGAAALGAGAGAAAAAGGGGAGGASAWQIAAAIVREGGPRALFSGVGAATLRLVPMAVVSFSVYELMRSWTVSAEAAWDRHVAELELRRQRRPRGSSGSGSGGALATAAMTTAGAFEGSGGGGGGSSDGGARMHCVPLATALPIEPLILEQQQKHIDSSTSSGITTGGALADDTTDATDSSCECELLVTGTFVPGGGGGGASTAHGRSGFGQQHRA